MAVVTTIMARGPNTSTNMTVASGSAILVRKFLHGHNNEEAQNGMIWYGGALMAKLYLQPCLGS